MQNLPAIVFTVLLGLVISRGWILPSVSLNLALSKQTLLNETARSIVEANRTNQASIPSELKSISIPGLAIAAVNSISQGDYLIFQIDFEHTGLFTSDIDLNKKIAIVTDLN